MRPGEPISLGTGLECELSVPGLPLLRNYYTLSLLPGERTATEVDTHALWAQAHRIARAIARQTFGDPECFSLLFNAARTRRRSWAHVHIIIARTPGEKRRALFYMFLKRYLRWRRWPVIRRLTARPVSRASRGSR